MFGIEAPGNWEIVDGELQAIHNMGWCSRAYLQLGKRRGKIMTSNLMLNHLRDMVLVGILQLLRGLKENGEYHGV